MELVQLTVNAFKQMNPAAPPESHTPHTRGLFDHLSSWLSDPVATFSAWAVTHPVEDTTREVKEFMWGKWCRWLKEASISLDRVEAKHLADFFEAEKIAKAQRYRYLRLIEVTYIHLNLLGLSIKNPGTQAAYDHLGKGQNDPTAFLSKEEKENVEKIIRAWLSALPGESGALNEEREEKEKKKRKGRKEQPWVRVRNAAVCSVMMGGGATVWALERLTVSCTNCSEGRVSLPRKGGAPYEAILLPIGQTGLDAWVRLRRTLGPAIGDWMFPADVKARKNPTTVTDTAGMHASTIFRAVRSVLREAGITGARACGQTLRNTYAATLSDLGFSDDEVATSMGFFEITSAIRIRAAWTQACGGGASETFD